MTQITALFVSILLAAPIAATMLLFAWRLSGAHQAQTLRAFSTDVFSDLAKMCAPLWQRITRIWAFWGPRLTNRAMWAAIFMDASLYSGGQDVWTFLATHKALLAAIIVMNLITPLSPAGAPSRIPGPGEAPRPMQPAI